MGESDPRRSLNTVRMIAANAGLSALAAKRLGEEFDAVSRALNIEPPNESAGVPPLFRHIGEIVAERREPQWLLRHILEERVLAVMAGPRGSFKSFVALDWALRVAVDGLGVAILSGEGSGLDRRVEAWLKVHAPGRQAETLPIVAIERPVALNRFEVRDRVVAELLNTPVAPHLLVIDTLSKFSPGIDENDNGQTGEFLSALASDLRDALETTVLLVAHAGHGDAKRPRGASVLMCNPDAEYIVMRPDPFAMDVTVSRERFKDTPSMPPLAYRAEVVDLGRKDAYGDAVTSLALHMAEAAVASRARGGRNQEAACAGLAEWVRTHPGRSDLPTLDLHDILKAQGLKDRRRRREIVDWLTAQRIVTASVGGFVLHAEALQ